MAEERCGKKEKKEPIKRVLTLPDMKSIVEWIDENRGPIGKIIADLLDVVDEIRRRRKR